jgi:glutaconate CoA-transferase, subunit A
MLCGIDMLLGGGCVSRVDAGFVAVSEGVLTEAMLDEQMTLTAWITDSLTLRLLGRAMREPLLPTWTLLGTDTLAYSGTKIMADPFTSMPSCLVPVLNPEEIIEIGEIRRHPSQTTIPYYCVDAIVHVPLGAYPGPCPGVYISNSLSTTEALQALDSREAMQRYLETYVCGHTFGVV